jgi:hypothetical protein
VHDITGDLRLNAIQAWDALASGQPAQDHEQAICEAFVTRDGHA